MPQPNPLFPATVITKLDALRAQKRIDTCRVQAKTTSVDRGGARIETWGALGDPVSCNVEPTKRAAQEGIRGGRVTPEADVEIRVHRTVVVRRDNRIQHVESGQSFDVVNDPTTVSIGLELVIAGKDSNG